MTAGPRRSAWRTRVPRLLSRVAGLPRPIPSLLLLAATLLLLEGFWRLAEPFVYEPHGDRDRFFVTPPDPGVPRPGALRVFLYGESTMAGTPHAPAGFVAQLSWWLGRTVPTRPVDFTNYALGSKASSFLVRRLEETIGDGPDLVVVMVGHNEFINRFDEDRLYFVRQGIQRSAMVRMAELLWIRARIAFDRWTRSSADGSPDAGRYSPDERRRKLDGFRANLSRVVELSRSRGVPLILCTAPSNLRDWPPLVAALDPALEGPARDLREGRPAPAAQALAALVDADPADPAARFLLGQALLDLGRPADARPHLVAARDLDPMPTRAPDGINDTIRELAAANPDAVTLVDADRAVERDAADGLPGSLQFVDAVHPTVRGSATIACEVLRALSARGLPAPSVPVPAAACDGGDTFLKQSGRLEPATGLFDYLESAARCSTPLVWNPLWPFLRDPHPPWTWLDEARRRFPDRWEPWADAASVSLLAGDVAKGGRELRTAASLAGGTLDPSRWQDAPYLARALRVACPDASAAACLERLTAP